MLMIRAVLFDFGGVILSSPFDAFTKYEQRNGLPDGLIRRINQTNPDTNAWAQFERGTLTPAGFADVFEAEGRKLGYSVEGRKVLACIEGDVRPEMVQAVGRVSDLGLATACLTNNVRSWETAPQHIREIMELFDHIVESSALGVRKPELKFYEHALELLAIDAAEAVFLDDLGVNLKPARTMGMTTIKVLSPTQALDDLGAVLGVALM
jgi:putative hydrolase of the HAD superfamily